MNNSYAKQNIRKHSPKAVLITALLVGVCTLEVISQVSFLNKGIIYNNSNQFVINGDVTHQQEGSIINSGNFYVRGNWTNDNPTNPVFTSGTAGWVHLDSAISVVQNIGGTTVTRFNNLELVGAGARRLDSINVEIEDTLDLNNKDFEAGDYIVYMLSSGTGVIKRDNNGFVSSTNDGGLSRNTATSETYLFPVGSNAGTSRYRPVTITPSTNNTFKVRMANIEATSEGFNLANREVTIGGANVNFYHRISSTNSSDAADVTVFYDPVTDGNFQLIAQWDNIWKNLGVVAETSDNNFLGITKSGHTNFYNTPFVLAEEMPAVFVANVFSPNGDGNNDVLHLLGNSIDELTFTIYDRWGGKVFETTDATVGWDGVFKGKPMNVGVFVYFAKGKFKNGEAFERNGNVTLLR